MKYLQFTLLALIALLITSCGGGGSGSTSTLSVDPDGDDTGLAELSAVQANLEEVTGGVELTLSVSNSGDVDSTACFGKYSAMSIDGTATYYTDTVTIPAIPAGETYSWVINVSFSSVPGDQSDAYFYIVYFVDSTELVPETDDDNNQESILIDAAALPDAVMAPG